MCGTAIALSSAAESVPFGYGPWGDNPTLEVVVVDDTGGLTLVFLARRQLAGVHPGTILRAEGMVGAHQRRLAMLNPVYALEHVPIR